ncbi:pitrilysin family protein [Gallaecimonas sp. GXIMD4217]|uniref:M16 family metallopeptidase n=1 Tax=Gallaecimonas sp. GXIMD4217 TaxID=3131927 RepID=UPI00311B34C3
MKRLTTALGLSLALSACQATQHEPAAAPVAAQAAKASFQLPAIDKRQLANGLSLQLMEHHEVPLIDISLVLKAGAIHDEQAGQAFITAQSLMLGTQKRSKDELEAQLDAMGASLGIGAGLEGTTLSARFLAKDADAMLALIQEVLTQPAFDADELAKYKQRHLARLAQMKESPKAVIGQYFAKLMYGEHPYGNAVMGTADSVPAIDTAAIKAYYRDWYRPENMVLSAVGDFDARAFAAKLQDSFGAWQPKGESPMVKFTVPQMPDKARVLLVNKSDAIETTFIIGGPGMAALDKDWTRVSVINTVLGGRFTSWLNDELRVNAGLTYGARSGFDADRLSGTFQISTFTKTATSQEAIELALKTYERLFEPGLDQATLDSAKAYVKGQFPPRFETSRQLAGLLSKMALYGYGPERINDFTSQVDGLSLADSRALASRHFPRQGLQFVLIGKADELRELAKRYGEVTEINIKDNGFAF